VLGRLSQVGLVVVAVLGGSVAPPMSAATAATSTEVTYFTADTDGDGTFGVYKRIGATVTSVQPEADGTAYHPVSASADGTRVSAGGVVRDAGGAVVATTAPVVMGPEGSKGAREEVYEDEAGHYTSVYWLDVATGRSQFLFYAQNHGDLVGFADDSHVLLDTKRAVPLSGRPMTIVIGPGAETLTTAYGNSSLSPSGDRIALAHRTASSILPVEIVVMPISVSGDVVTLGAPTPVAVGGFNVSPTWTQDGLSIRYVHRDSAQGSGDIYTVPATGGSAVATPTPADEGAVAVAEIDDTAPGAATTAPAVLQGTTTEVRWTNPPDADLSGVIVTRKQGNTEQKTAYVLAPLSGYVDTGLTLGQTYTYVLQPVDRSGNSGPTTARTVTTMRVDPWAPDPVSNTQSQAANFPVRFATSAPPGARFTVDYRVLPDTVWRHWVVDAPGTQRGFGEFDPGAEPTEAREGKTYEFHVTGTDGHGNVTPTETSARIAVPYNDSVAIYYPGTGHGSRPDRWYFDVSTLFASKQTATITLTGDRFQVIGERLPNGGRFAVYGKTGGGSWVRLGGTVDTYASSRQPRKVLFSYWFSAPITVTYQVRWVPGPTSTRKVVALDAFAIRR
jgi:hypothetical protein